MNGLFESGRWEVYDSVSPSLSLSFSSSAGVIRMDPCVSLPLNESLVSIGNEIEVERGEEEGPSSHLNQSPSPSINASPLLLLSSHHCPIPLPSSGENAWTMKGRRWRRRREERERVLPPPPFSLSSFSISRRRERGMCEYESTILNLNLSLILLSNEW